MAYRLKVFNNAYYMDEEEAYLFSDFSTYESALAAAKAIVKEFMIDNYAHGIQALELFSRYSLHG